MLLKASQAQRLARPAARPAARNRAVVRPVAFKDATRAERLKTVANEYVRAWIKGTTRGPASTALDLRSIVSNDVTIMSSHSPFDAHVDTGVDGLLKKVNADHNRGMHPSRVLHTVVNEATDTVFCLVENKPRKGGNCPAALDIADAAKIPAWSVSLSMDDEWTDRAPSCPRIAHSILKLYIMRDSVLEVRECSQPAYDTGAPFPEKQILTTGRSSDTDRNWALAEEWANSFSSTGNLGQLDKLAIPALFKFYDAYGQSTLFGPKGECEEGHTLEWLKERDQRLKEDFNVSCRVIDYAASPSHSLGFMHWVADLTPKDPESGHKPFIINCIQAETYQIVGKEVRLTSVWAFRDVVRPEA